MFVVLNNVQVRAQAYFLLNVYGESVPSFIYWAKGHRRMQNLCRIGTDIEDDMAVPRRVELAAPHGGLFWISPAF